MLADHYVSNETNLGSYVYPFLSELKRADWRIASYRLPKTAVTPNAPTLTWVKDNKVMELQFDHPLSTEAFLSQLGWSLSTAKGGYVLSKRISRLMRPYCYWLFTDSVNVKYDEQLDPDLWDGCGLMSRQMAHRIADARAESLTPKQKRELQEGMRFEVTLMSEMGQDKGHVLVVDGLEQDFIFPAGSSKREIQLTNGRYFVGLTPIHHEDQMLLDIQSLINLHPFLRVEQLIDWMRRESEFFLERIENGQLEELLARLKVDTEEELDHLTSWPITDYMASGGQLTWFAGMVKGVANQHLKRLKNRHEKVRFPVPGARYYIFPAAVGARNVGRGEIELDPHTATAWVNSDDWNEYIVTVLGGCDGDDALWVYPFVDLIDNDEKLLIWRSPNQLGEYVLLRPTSESHRPMWPIAGGSVLNRPHNDSRLLPTRIDQVTIQYEELVATTATAVTSIAEAMAEAQAIAEQNRGVLGAYCNMLMVCKAIYGRLPHKLPARLEDVIDGTVKEGRDLSHVMAWIQHANECIITQGKRIPSMLDGRLQGNYRLSRTHWLDELTVATESHIQSYKEQVHALAKQAMPPARIFAELPVRLREAKMLRQLYADSLREEMKQQRVDRFERIARRCGAYLSRFTQVERAQILLSAVALIYADEEKNDALLWQLGEKEEEQRLPGIAHEMLDALRSIGVLGSPTWTAVGAVSYYETEVAEKETTQMTITAVWFNWLKAKGSSFNRMSDVPAELRSQAKEAVKGALGKMVGMQLRAEAVAGDMLALYSGNDKLVGYVREENAHYLVGEWVLLTGTAGDGNVSAIVARS